MRAGLLALAAAIGFGVASNLGAQPVGSPGASSAAATRWTVVRGEAVDLSVSPKGDVFALDPTGRLWRLPAEEAKSNSANWQSQPGRYRRVRATYDGTSWGIDPGGSLYRLRGSAWIYTGQDGVLDVAAAPDGQAYVLLANGSVLDLESRRPFQPAYPVTESPAQTLVLDGYGLPWLQRADRSVVRFDGTAWQNVAGAADRLETVAAGYDGTILAIAATGQIMRFAPAQSTWQPYLADARALPALRLLAISPIGLPWGISRSGELLAERPLGTPPPAVTPSVFTRLLTWRPTGRTVAQVSVGEDGNVFVVAPEPDGSVYRRVKGNQWTQVRMTDGKARAIAAGTGERAWALTDKGALIQFDGGFQQTLQAPAQLRLIASGPKGSLWGVVGADDLQQWNSSRRAWEPVMKLPLRPVSISIGSRGEPWLIDDKGAVRTRGADGAWKALPGITATSVSVGADGTIYATSTDEGIYYLDKLEMRWKPASGKAKKVAVGPGGAALAIGAGNELLLSGRFPDAATPAAPTQTAAAPRRTTPTTTTTSTESTPSQTSTTSTTSAFVVVPPGATGPVLGVPGATTPGGFVSGPALVIGSTTGFTVTMPRTATTKPLVYETIVGDARFNDIGIGASGAVFAASTDGGLMCFNNGAKGFVLASSGINSRVAVAPDGMPWILDTNGRVSRFDKLIKQWRIVPSFTGVDISFGPDGQLWAAANTGSVYRYNTAGDSFDLESVLTSDVSFRARRVAGANPVSGGRAYWVVSEQGQLIRCEKGDCRVALVGASDAAVAPDNTLFALDLLGNVQRYDATKKLFEKQNGSGTAIAVGPGGFPWLVTSAGKIDSSGIYAAGSKTINAPDCAAAFVTAPAPLPPPPSVTLVANADSATVAPGGSFDLLANDTFAGRAASIGDVTVSLDTASPLLSLSGGTVLVSLDATAATVLSGNYKICPRNVQGNCVSSTVTITVSGTSTVPTSVTAVGGDRQATLSFTAPGVGGVSSYTVVSNPGGLLANGTSSPITITGLTNGIAYNFTVTARYSNGTSKTSLASNTVTPSAAITEPGPPTIGTAVAASGQATVSFTAPASNGGSSILDYKVTSLPGGVTVTGTSSPITVTGLTNGTAYTFSVQARNLIGLGTPSAASNSVTPMILTAPGTPTVGTVVSGNASATVPFTAPASTGGSAITSYVATSNPGGFTGTSTTSPITVTGLTNGTVYTFTVAAINAIGTSLSSAASNSVTPTAAPTAPGAPTGVVATPGNTTASVAFAAPASNGGSAITSYTVTASPGGATASGAGSPLVVTGLTNGTAYTFTVTATNAIGTSAASAASASVLVATVPGAPTISGAVPALGGAFGNGQATVTFTAPATGGSPITGYTVVSTPPGGVDSNAGTTALSHSINGLVGGTAYTFTVTAANAIGVGAASAASGIATPITVPDVPIVGAVSSPASGQVSVTSFTPPASNGGSAITSYTATASPGGASSAPAGNPPWLIGGLIDGTPYTITMTATNAAGSSLPSAGVPGMPIGPPSPPTGVGTGPQIVQLAIDVIFGAPVSDGGDPSITYTITPSCGSPISGTPGVPNTLVGLTAGPCNIDVTATNSRGTSSPASTSVTVLDNPGSPAPLTGTPQTPTTIQWTWAAASTGGDLSVTYMLQCTDITAAPVPITAGIPPTVTSPFILDGTTTTPPFNIGSVIECFVHATNSLFTGPPAGPASAAP